MKNTKSILTIIPKGESTNDSPHSKSILLAARRGRLSATRTLLSPNSTIFGSRLPPANAHPNPDFILFSQDFGYSDMLSSVISPLFKKFIYISIIK